jgi:hypothetical protein
MRITPPDTPVPNIISVDPDDAELSCSICILKLFRTNAKSRSNLMGFYHATIP